MNEIVFKGAYICSCGAYIRGKKIKESHDCKEYKNKIKTRTPELDCGTGTFFSSVTVHKPYKR